LNAFNYSIGVLGQPVKTFLNAFISPGAFVCAKARQDTPQTAL
jgi:hypothetical protein